MPPIVTPKTEPMKVLFRWDPATVEDIDAIARDTGRSRNETAEILIRWAVQETKREMALAEKGAAPRKK